MMLPVEYILTKRRFSQEVADRIRRLNPNGVEEGNLLRGWFPHRKSVDVCRDEMAVSQFIQKFGREKYRTLPRDAIRRHGHRKAVVGRFCWGD